MTSADQRTSRAFTAHIELADGRYHSFTITAPNVQQAYKIALARTDEKAGNIMRGVSENEQ